MTASAFSSKRLLRSNVSMAHMQEVIFCLAEVLAPEGCEPYLDRGVFRELKDINYFNQVGILFGAVTWPHEQDIAPETLISEMILVEDVHV